MWLHGCDADMRDVRTRITVGRPPEPLILTMDGIRKFGDLCDHHGGDASELCRRDQRTTDERLSPNLTHYFQQVAKETVALRRLPAVMFRVNLVSRDVKGESWQTQRKAMRQDPSSGVLDENSSQQELLKWLKSMQITHASPPLTVNWIRE